MLTIITDFAAFVGFSLNLFNHILDLLLVEVKANFLYMFIDLIHLIIFPNLLFIFQPLFLGIFIISHDVFYVLRGTLCKLVGIFYFLFSFHLL